MRVEHNKLVRDGIPEVIEKNGAVPKTRILESDEYKKRLLEKLIEEASELFEDPGLEERADVQEVLLAIDAIFGFSREKIEAVRSQKLEQRGGFEDRIFLEFVEE